MLVENSLKKFKEAPIVLEIPDGSFWFNNNYNFNIFYIKYFFGPVIKFRMY